MNNISAFVRHIASGEETPLQGDHNGHAAIPLSSPPSVDAVLSEDMVPSVGDENDGPRGQHVPRAIESSLPVTAAILQDLREDYAAGETRLKDLREQEKSETQAIKDETAKELAVLDGQQAGLNTELSTLTAREDLVLSALLASATTADEKAGPLREVRMNRTTDKIEARTASLDAALESQDTTMAAMQTDLAKQEREAAKAYAKAGLSYPSGDPLSPPPSGHEEPGQDMGPGGDAHPVPPRVAWFITIVSGIAAGVSLGLAAHFLHADTLDREGIIMAVCACFGIATSLALKYGLQAVWGEVSYRLSSDKWSWVSTAVAIALTSLVIAIYSTVELRGLMSGLLLELITSAVRSKTPPDSTQIQMVARFGSLFLTVPYVLLCSSIGWWQAQHEVKVTAAQEKCLTEHSTRINSAEVKAALSEGNLVTVIRQSIERYETRSNSNIQRLSAEITALTRDRAYMEEEMMTTTTPQQDGHFATQAGRLRRERQTLDDRIAAIETRKKEVAQKAAVIPSTSRAAEVQEKLKILEARIAHEENEARHKIELSTGNLIQRLRAALGTKKPVGALHYHVNDKAI